MDKKVILAIAGSGKTSFIVDALVLNDRSLVITYTENNLTNLRTKILRKFGYLPQNITICSYFTFLYSFCFRPFLLSKIRARGINWQTPPNWTLKIKRDSMQYYLDKQRRLYHNRIAKLLDLEEIMGFINERIEKYFDNLFIDEIQDFAGHDYNFLKSISKANINITYVGDFYQHTFDTSRDGTVNKNLHDDFAAYVKGFEQMGLTVDCTTLGRSYRCSPTVCTFITQKLGINIMSHREDETKIILIDQDQDAKSILKCQETVKLFYKEHYKYPCFSRNWGDSKGEDHYWDVCVVLNKETFKKFEGNRLCDLKPQTRNKFYVACSRVRNNLYFISEDACKRYLCAS